MSDLSTAGHVAGATRRRLSTIRHITLFDPAKFAENRVDVVGCGSVGGRIAMEIAKLGIRNLHVWDADDVAEHNIANQPYALADVGRQKVDVLAEDILASTGTSVTTHNEFVEGSRTLGRVVFLAVDSMAARKSIFEGCLRMKITTDLVVETRMGVEEYRVYGFNPHSLREIRAWEATLYPDAPARPNACQMRTTIGATAAVNASLAVHRFLHWYRREFVWDPAFSEPPHFGQIVLLRPHTVITQGVPE